MTATGIGAPVRRKEDQRFITGKGQYTDDINRPGQAYAFFVRSPHAHADIKRIDTERRARRCRACVAVFTGEDLAADKVGGLICGWMIHSKDGSPMKAGPHPALAQGKVRYVGDHVAVVIAETLAQAQGRRRGDRRRLRRAAGRRRHRDGAQSGDAQIHDDAPDNTVYHWHLGDKARDRAAFANAKHVTKIDLVNNRLIPNADRAARRHRRVRFRHRRLHALHDEPEPARGAARALGLHRHRARAQAARDRARRRRRLRLEDLHLCRGDGLPLGREEGRPAGEVDLRPHRGLPLPTRMAATTSPTPSWRSTTTARSWPAGQDHGQSRRLSVDLRLLGADLSLRAAAVGPVRHPGDLLRGRRASTPTPRRSMPIAAPAGRRRPSWSSGWSRWRRARSAWTRPKFRSSNFITKFPHQTPVIMTYDAGDYARLARQGAGARRLQGLRQAQARQRPQRQAARHRLLGLHRGLRHRAVGRRSARSAPASACGNRPRCGSTRPARSRC